jgi:hypothetical protein
MDIPTMLLHLYGLPIPEDYDGRVLSEVINPEFIGRHPVRYQPGDAVASISLESPYSAEETEELISRLRALGYVG